MATYVIIGTDPQGLDKYIRRNVSESYAAQVVAEYEGYGWTRVVAVRESF